MPSKEDLRIALLTDGITPFVTGGMQRHSFLVAKYLLAEGIRVDLYTTEVVGTSKADMAAVFPSEFRDKLRVFTVPFQDQGKLPGHYVRASYRFSVHMFEALTSRDLPDFIYAKGFTAWHTIKQKQAGVELPPIGVKFHGMNMFQPQASWSHEISKHFFRKPVKWICRNADYVFSYGGEIDQIIRSIGVNEGRLVSVPTGIESDWLTGEEPRPIGDELRLLFVGRHDRVKGLPELYKALSILKTNVNWRLDVVGPIPEAQQLQHSRVHYAGLVREAATLQAYYDQSHIVLCTSISEGMPNVILEGMARGNAVATTKVGAATLLVDQQTGWLFSSLKPNILSRELKAMIETDRAAIEAKRKAAKVRVETDYRWDSIAPRLIAEIETIIQHSRA